LTIQFDPQRRHLIPAFLLVAFWSSLTGQPSYALSHDPAGLPFDE
jgi:hypothetical protein